MIPLHRGGRHHVRSHSKCQETMEDPGRFHTITGGEGTPESDCGSYVTNCMGVSQILSRAIEINI